MSTELTPTQLAIIEAAASQSDGLVEFPATLRGGARTRVIDALLGRNLITEVDGAFRITDDGYAAVGRIHTEEVTTETIEEIALPTAPRENTKQAAVVGMLKRAEGATISQLMVTTGWQAHTLRATLSVLRKKLGLTITSEKSDGIRVYRITE